MSQMRNRPAARARTYGTALSAWVGSALVAAALVAAGDIGLTLAGAEGVRAAQALLFGAVALALYLGLGLLVGMAEGVVAGALGATHPEAGGLRRLVDDRDRDLEATAALLAFVAVAAVYALVVARLAMRLVALPERKAVGALLLGGAAAALVPVAVLAGYPVFRAARHLAPLVPRIGRAPRTLVCAALLVTAIAAATAFYVATRLDWRVLPLALPITALGFAAAQALALALARGRWRRGPVAAAAALAALAPVLAVALAQPDQRTVALMTLESRATRTLVAIARGFFDRDGDGFSSVLGGGDCDDHDPTVHPGAKGRGKGCLGADEPLPPSPAPVPPPATAAADPPAPAPARRLAGNVLFIAVDTLRADRLGAAGYKRRHDKSLTPSIDALIQRGVWFRRVYAQAPNTPRSFPSIFTSRFPSEVKWDSPFQNYPKVLPGNTTLFEALQAAGVRTVGEASHFYFTPARGITQGFDEFDDEGAKSIHDSNHDIAAPRIVPRALARMKELAADDRRWILFVHLFEPHSTYMEHPEFPIEGKGLEGLEEKYDYEIAFVDRYVGQLVDAAPKDTTIVLISDHGEAFGKHRYGGERMFFHGQTLYDELLHVPVIVAVPGQPARTVDEPAMLIDVAPTVAELMGVAAPTSFKGRSLVPYLLGDTLPPRPVHAELLPAPEWNHDAKMMIAADGRTKIIYRISDSLFELYDLAADPDEQRNLIDEHKDVARRMKQAIAAWMESEL
jgi:arylsulfatase A-like enzyme